MLSRRLIRIKTIKSLYSHICSDESSLIKSEKEYRYNLKKCYELYLAMFGIIVEVADYAQKRIDIGLAKLRPTELEKNPNLRFVENRMVEMIRTSNNLTDSIVREKVSLKLDELVIKDLYNQMIEAPYFKAYMSSSKSDFASDKKMVVDFYRNHIEDNEDFEAAIEDISIFWSDDINFVLSHVITTLSSVKERDQDIEIPQMYKNDDDRQYSEILYRKSVVKSNEYFEYVEKITQNWDFERIAMMDKIILLAAITELIEFPSIPVKVTMDEFIEIAKYYSTSGSGVFVNGIIDKAIHMLTEEGKIVKSGRGLIDS